MKLQETIVSWSSYCIQSKQSQKHKKLAFFTKTDKKSLNSSILAVIVKSYFVGLRQPKNEEKLAWRKMEIIFEAKSEENT